MIETGQLKACCAAAYESDFARALLGDSFHPGGLELTARLGELLGLHEGDRVLDVAAGTGTSAIFLARQFGCKVVGIEISKDQVARAADRAEETGMGARIKFERGDAEQLAMPDGGFDVVICECAFCTFPEKQASAREFARVLVPGGRVGLSDLNRSGPLPRDLEGLLAWIACIADARPAGEYISYLQGAGFSGVLVEGHDAALAQLVRDIQGRLLASELMAKLNQQLLPGVDFEQAKLLARSAAEAVRSGLLGYSLITARKDLC